MRLVLSPELPKLDRWLEVALLASGAVLLAMVRLVPFERLPPLCSFKFFTGHPCPSCGMTTSFAHAANGNLLGSVRAQPAGAVLALGTAMVFVLSIWVLATGSAIGAFWFDRIGRRFFIFGGILIVGAWVYKILVFKGVL